ncbi:hypothetical protein NSK_003750 [Nannochloropsis salina CCMP1776]|uniref:Tr-type G domain-containing protein n=1 Tax=Nannochloropsis salina CCMP1776 TaxID=1027361 RepID=A0A4D9D7U7_9STRA|nr:hypothetical protein NSK_003750 [Nannochloropsis salina CCMP1776]|eukprot:TFJ84718.1 hypothetical protein NSK_003750 [Nannochloropsis salina CCMP1776]
MSRHRAVRNRTYSYDDDYDDYGYEDEEEEEEEEGEGTYAYHRRQQLQGHLPSSHGASLSSLLDHAAAQHNAPVAPILRSSQAGPRAPVQEDVKGTHPRLATISEAFDADLVDPAFHLIKGSGQVGELSDDQIRTAVRQANYDADVALSALLLLPPSTPPATSSSSSSTPSSSQPPSAVPSRVVTPSPSRLSSPEDGGRGEQGRGLTAGTESTASLPPPLPPGQLVRPTPQRRSSGNLLLGNQSRNNSSSNLSRPTSSNSVGEVEEVTSRVQSVHLSRASTPPPRFKSASPGLGEGEDGCEGAQAGAGNVIASRASLGGLSKDPEVWEEDVLPSKKEGEKEGEKARIAMVVIGHVDAGKSTLMGQVLVSTGTVSVREARKFERDARALGKASFYLAWMMDEDGEERAHGVTMEVGQKRIELPHRVVTLLDAPGHADFVPQMIVGAAQADVALLVVPATTGEFEAGFAGAGTGRDGLSQGQTKEHALLARALGVNQILVAVNKLDAADPPWSQARYQGIVTSLTPFLEQTGFKSERIRFVPVSGLTGENVKEGGREGGKEGGGGLREWYTGPSLLTAMDDFLPAAKFLREARGKPLRMIVNDLAPAGKNVGVSVRVLSGGVKTGSKVLILPIGDVAVVRSIEVEGSPAEVAGALEHAEITLQGVDPARISIGSVLCKGKAAVPVSCRFAAQITTLSSLSVPILRGTPFQMHVQSLEIPVNATRLTATLAKPLSEEGRGAAEVKKERPRCLTGNMLALVEFQCARPVCVERFEDSRPLGRFILRQKGETVAVGIVTEILPDT